MGKDFRPRLKGKIKKAYENLITDQQRILVIGDLHEPFCLEGYLKHCKDVYAKHNCNKVIFIGDVIDNHYSSYHDPDPDGMGGGDELDLAIDKLSRWYKAFPVADVCIGNHDRIISRKMFSSGVPKRWIKGLAEEMFTEFAVGANYKVFGCAVGCGINSKSYAMAYGKHFKKPAIGCAVVFGGKHAINEPMHL